MSLTVFPPCWNPSRKALPPLRFVTSLLCFCLFFFRCFDGNFRVIRQTIGAGRDYTLPLFQPVKNLHVLILPYSDLHCQLADVLIGANDNHSLTAVRGSQ